MSQEKIKVVLTEKGESDLLTFHIKENDKDLNYVVDLSDPATSQAQLKRIFSRLFTILTDKDIQLVLEIEEGFSRTLQKEVCEEYIRDLNQELISVKEILNAQLSSGGGDPQ